MGSRFAAPHGLEIAEVLRQVKEGAQGKIVDVEDTEDGERVEIYVE